MQPKREEVLIEGGIRSACYKAGKIFMSNEMVDCRKFEKLYAASTKHAEKFSRCYEISYRDYDSKYIVVRCEISCGTPSIDYLCGFCVSTAHGPHSGKYIHDVWVENKETYLEEQKKLEEEYL